MGRGGRAARPAREAGLPPKFLYIPADGNKPSADYYVELNDKVKAVLKNVRPGEEQDLSARVARDGALVYPNRYQLCGKHASMRGEARASLDARREAGRRFLVVEL